ncbi:acyl CoA:acetate/3-ketoacid CoA transferase [Pseudochrobactrum algeriensis]|uniref:acyl CoA:acetate/3-ketoacid CoA transferase n=1 Tax=Pseudochrobactrum algeriensis TaxID=2834768 RepID=UPI001BCD383B|nr:acyl CoA:acetate/3-ketoacid CoA transferase [Pseudochrobactrum algeriensis]MBX8811980.1 acyl CoA:acetate/3-ketoacid CoA transferase [Ochrobactrum sp. MR34]QVQ35614.1 acyl CoA:acetate/3-ketoacid CoA transferase [Pseudochrobactrum algeriensis]QVQ38834.1 acyl CoA:acetate/3-ketoacid CoA transferase [Pseudochrobactrum algeriensis]QVQ42747.1 acyl CoA:acetate/3-ketoacid CoA transferase [Pseudochrobactrum algeriensis]
MSKHITPAQAAALIPDHAVVTVSSSSGLGCPDLMLRAIGERFEATGHPRNLTTLHPIAAGDMSGIKGIDHIAKKGLLAKIIGGSYPSGPSSAEPPLIWQMIGANEIPAYNVPSGILFDMHREAAAKRPGVITKIGLDTFVDPDRQGCAMNEAAQREPLVRKIEFADEEWLYFPNIIPQVAIIRATTADEHGNLTYEHEGATLGGLDQALAARNNGGIVIAQVKRITKQGSLKPHDVRVPGMLVDYIIIDPEQKQTTQTVYDPAISGEIFRPLESFRVPEFNVQKVIARRVAQELESGSCVNLGFGISANVPRILMEEGLHGSVTWVIEQGAVGGVPLLDFAFGCASNADAYMPSPYQFTYFQGGGFDASLLSFLEIGRDGSVNVSRLSFRPHVTAGAGGFVDITARAKKIVFSGMFNAGAKLGIEGGGLVIEKEGKLKKLVNETEHVTFSGSRAVAQGQDITYVTERCVMKLTPQGIMLTEIAPGVDLQAHILEQSEFPLIISPELKLMDAALFREEPLGLTLPEKPQLILQEQIEGGDHD